MALTKAKLIELIDNGDIDVGGGGLSNPMPDTTLIANLNADLLDGVHLADIRLGQNILHNWDFRNPVNQRGVSGTISTGTYFYDRWIRNSGTVTVAAGYLTLASGAVVEQRIEGNLLAGVICTVSFEVGSTIYHGSGVFPANNGTVSVEVDGYPNITFGCATGYMFVLIPATSNTSIKRFKCEMGFVSTLHLDPPADYGMESIKCFRYAKKLLVDAGRLTSYTAGILYFKIQSDVPMRIATPSIIGTFDVYTVGQVLQSGFSFSVNYANMAGFHIFATKAAHGMTDAMLWAGASGVIISADL